MKFTLITAVSALSTLASGLVLPDLARRGAPILPDVAVTIKEEFPTSSFPAAEVSRVNGNKNVKTLLGFIVPACSGTCTISFSDATSSTGSQRMQLFTTGGYPTKTSTWLSKPFTDIHKGTFKTSASGAGAATVVEDFGLTFQCPTTSTKYGYEVQPVWDNDSIKWDPSKAGFVITCT